MKKTIISIILTTFGFSALAPIPAYADKDTLTFQVTLPTKKKHFSGGNGPTPLELRFVPLNELHKHLESYRDYLPSFKKQGPIFYIYLPSREAYAAQKEILTEAAYQEFEKIFPGVTPRIVFRVPDDPTDLKKFRSIFRKRLIAEGENLPNDPAIQTYKNEVLGMEAEAYKKAQQVEMELAAQTGPLIPSKIRMVKWVYSFTRALVVGTVRSIQTVPGITRHAEPILAGFALIGGDPTIEFYTNYYLQKIQHSLAKFSVLSPLGKIPAIKPETMASINQFANNLLIGTARPLLMQTLSHVAGASVPVPSLPDILSLGALTTVGSFAFTLGNRGAKILKQKGITTATVIDVVAMGFGLMDVLTGIFSSNPALHSLRWYTWGTQWPTFLGIWLYANMAPVRINEIVVVDSSIEDWENIHAEQRTDESWHVHPENIEEVKKTLEMMQNLEDLPMLEETTPTGFGVRCRNLLARGRALLLRK